MAGAPRHLRHRRRSGRDLRRDGAGRGRRTSARQGGLLLRADHPARQGFSRSAADLASGRRRLEVPGAQPALRCPGIRVVAELRRHPAGRRRTRCGVAGCGGRAGRGDRADESHPPAGIVRHLPRYGTGVGAHVVHLAEVIVGGRGRGDRRYLDRRGTGRTPQQRADPPGAAGSVHGCGLPGLPRDPRRRAGHARSVPAAAVRPGSGGREDAAPVLLPGPLA